MTFYLEVCEGNMQANVQQCLADIDHLVKTSETWGLSVNECTVIRFKPRGSSVTSQGDLLIILAMLGLFFSFPLRLRKLCGYFLELPSQY